MPVNEPQLTPEQKEVLEAYEKKLNKESQLRVLIAQKEEEIRVSKKRTVAKLNDASAAISASTAEVATAFSASVDAINASYCELDKRIAVYEEPKQEGGEDNA